MELQDGDADAAGRRCALLSVPGGGGGWGLIFTVYAPHDPSPMLLSTLMPTRHAEGAL